MNNLFVRLVFVTAVLMCTPHKQYAAFPIDTAVIGYAEIDSPVYKNNEGYAYKKTDNTESYESGKKHKQSRSKTVAIILASISILFGGLGLHRFYLGYTLVGILELLAYVGNGIGALFLLVGLLGGGLGFFIAGILLICVWLASWLSQIVDLVLICTNNLTQKKDTSKDQDYK